jgi:hypothetical protein
VVSQAQDSSSDNAPEVARRYRRVRESDMANTLRPSPVLVRWIHRAILRLTDDSPQWATGARDGALQSKQVPPTERASTPNVVPNEVSARFVRVGRDYHFPSGAQAFRDHGHKVVARTENASVVRALVQIAMERGWQDITVSGTARFRHDVWRIATVSGLLVRGYRPSDFEKQMLVRELAAARGAAPESRRGARTSRGADEDRSPEPRSPRSDRSGVAAADRRERIYAGMLLEHGPSPYDFHPQGEPSYFVRIRTEHGPTLLWGKDLERALHDAKVTPGDEVRIRQAGRQTVTVRRKERDNAGRVLNEHNIKTHRNQWEVHRDSDAHEQTDRSDVEHRGNAVPGPIRRRSGERQEVDGALLALKGAQLFADQRIKDPAQRSAFVNAVREELARLFDRGERAPIPRLREDARERDMVHAKTAG